MKFRIKKIIYNSTDYYQIEYNSEHFYSRWKILTIWRQSFYDPEQGSRIKNYFIDKEGNIQYNYKLIINLLDINPLYNTGISYDRYKYIMKEGIYIKNILDIFRLFSINPNKFYFNTFSTEEGAKNFLKDYIKIHEKIMLNNAKIINSISDLKINYSNVIKVDDLNFNI